MIGHDSFMLELRRAAMTETPGARGGNDLIGTACKAETRQQAGIQTVYRTLRNPYPFGDRLKSPDVFLFGKDETTAKRLPQNIQCRLSRRPSDRKKGQPSFW